MTKIPFQDLKMIYFKNNAIEKVNFNGVCVWQKEAEMIKKLLGGNWKMNKTDTETSVFLDELMPLLDLTKNVDVVIFPPFTSLKTANLKRNSTALKIGAQDLSTEAKGAYTGQISAPMLADLNVEYALVGQSESRMYYRYSNADVNQKLLKALEYGIKPILCVGETLDEHEDGISKQTVEIQVIKALKNTTTDQLVNVTICYEPVWAIGTGKTCSPEEAQQMCAGIRNCIRTIYADAAASNMRIIYGGAVNTGNAEEFDAKPDINGFLCGGVALKSVDFANILSTIH